MFDNEKPTGGATAKSQTSLAYKTIRSAIISGEHPPGKKLKIQDLAEELKVTPGAVREALSRLVPEQLVLTREQRGFVVAPLSIADLVDLTDLRCEIETIALRRSLARGDIDWEVRLISASHRLRSLPQPAPGEPAIVAKWLAKHADFHAALISACDSPRLMALHAQLYEQSERYRVLSVQMDTKRDVAAEHDRLEKLALSRDTDGLVREMTEHIRTTTALIVASAVET